MTGKRKTSSSPVRSPSSPRDNQSCCKDPERLLPIANVSRLMKRTLPTNAKISKEAKETVQECVSEFISFITGEASNKCLREKRKAINGDDLLWAMTTLGFKNYVDPLKNYLNKFRELEENKTSMTRQDHHEATNDDHLHHEQQQQQFNSMHDHLGVGKVVNFGGNNKREFDDGLMGVEDYNQVVNFGGTSNKNKRRNGFDNGSVSANGAKLHHDLHR